MKRLAGLIDINDAFALTGTALLSYGLYTVWPPAAFMASGVILLAFSVIGARR